MFDIFQGINNWVKKDQPFALATVIRTWGSSPRPIGSALAVSTDMDMLGSVSGGCVEGAVMKKALKVIESGIPAKLKFGVSDEEAWAVGLSCGGAIHVWVEPFPAFSKDVKEVMAWEALQLALSNNKGIVLIRNMSADTNKHTVLQADGSVVGQSLSEDVQKAAQTAYKERKSQVIELEEGNFFLQVFPRKQQLLIVGAAHITADLVTLGNMYDFETIVIDPRGIFANKTQFPHPPSQLHLQWPEEVLHNYDLDAYAYAVLLTHDPKIDDQALHILLKSDVGYIGALGSRRTHAKRVKRLTEAGFSEEQIHKIHGPIGVDINAKRPKEIALSIMGEIIRTQNEHL
ncbi:MAG: XdhC family protein [Saprospiraceae bacterium]|jgi:xanthine dehydrogenase accessory factor|nr:XdhC family protein [Saprospiraceae bacterium]